MSDIYIHWLAEEKWRPSHCLEYICSNMQGGGLNDHLDLRQQIAIEVPLAFLSIVQSLAYYVRMVLSTKLASKLTDDRIKSF